MYGIEILIFLLRINKRNVSQLIESIVLWCYLKLADAHDISCIGLKLR